MSFGYFGPMSDDDFSVTLVNAANIANDQQLAPSYHVPKSQYCINRSLLNARPSKIYSHWYRTPANKEYSDPRRKYQAKFISSQGENMFSFGETLGQRGWLLQNVEIHPVTMPVFFKPSKQLKRKVHPVPSEQDILWLGAMVLINSSSTMSNATGGLLVLTVLTHHVKCHGRCASILYSDTAIGGQVCLFVLRPEAKPVSFKAALTMSNATGGLLLFYQLTYEQRHNDGRLLKLTGCQLSTSRMIFERLDLSDHFLDHPFSDPMPPEPQPSPAVCSAPTLNLLSFLFLGSDHGTYAVHHSGSNGGFGAQSHISPGQRLPNKSSWTEVLSSAAQDTFCMEQLMETTANLNLQQGRICPIDLLQQRDVPRAEPPEPNLTPCLRKLNRCSDVFQCTLMNIPQSLALLKQVKLPLGLIFQPFKDSMEPPLLITDVPPRCSMCQTYINPFITFIDQRHWKCSTCFSLNDVPGKFLFDPMTGSNCDPHSRPELQHAAVEFMVPLEYQAGRPRPVTYLFVFDVSYSALETGYLEIVCKTLLENIDRLPGDSRTRIGFITFDSTVNFYHLHGSLFRPRMMTVADIDDIFVPSEDRLLVNLQQSRQLVVSLLEELPITFRETQKRQCAFGPALQAAQKLLKYCGGRVSAFLTQLPNKGCGSLQPREDPGDSTLGAKHLGPAVDFYKVLALEFCGQQTGVDLFLLSQRYTDLASIVCVPRYTCGYVYYYPAFHHIHSSALVEKLQEEFRCHLTRSIGYEGLLRIRYTKGLVLDTFYGNSYLQSTQMLSLPCVCPQAEFAFQMMIDGAVTQSSFVVFQSSLLYTSCQGERRVRIYTYCLPVVSSLSDVYAGVNMAAIVGILSKMAVDHSMRLSLAYTRDELIRVLFDALVTYRASACNPQQSTFTIPQSLLQLPLYVLALLKQPAFQTDSAMSLDERVFTMCQLMVQPLAFVLRMVYPDLYRIDDYLDGKSADNVSVETDMGIVKRPVLIQLTAENLTLQGAFLIDCGNTLLPILQNPASKLIQALLGSLRKERLYHAPCFIVKDDSTSRSVFIRRLVDDRTETAMSYYEFLLHLKERILLAVFLQNRLLFAVKLFLFARPSCIQSWTPQCRKDIQARESVQQRYACTVPDQPG
ncbi:protein transport protein Sec24A-like [Heterodontus francisci]|uniref:protein transport protein Sec24A-like n=1 Tax=Heterodontus francisci TaxID=7792 RepID=UPI00355B746A